MYFTAKLVSGILVTTMAVGFTHETAEPVRSRAPEPPHNHPELHPPMYGMRNEAGISGGGSNTKLKPATAELYVQTYAPTALIGVAA